MAQGKLGFGFMRLPVLDGNQENIDFEQLDQMMDVFLGNGFTYLTPALPITTERAKVL